MKNFRLWSLIGMAAVVGGTMSACGGKGGDSSSGNASVRIANATLTHPSLDLLVNSTASASATTADNVSAYVSPAGGSVTLQINDAGAGTALATTVPTLTGGNHYTLVVYEAGGAVKTAVLNEDYTAPTTGTAQLRVYDAALDAGKLDVYITDPAVTDLTTVAANATFTTTTANSATALLTYSPGTYRVRITAAGSKTDVRADIPSVTLTSQQIATVILTPASGGVLVNGSTLIQQGAYGAARNPNIRVRLAAAVSGGAMVGATSSNGAVIAAPSVAPQFGFYATVPFASSLNITVNGQSVAAPVTTGFKAGDDVTLLVSGAPASAAATLIKDDNRLPTDATTTKLRLINGITGNVGTLTLTANTALVGTNIAYGAASSYAQVIGSTSAMNLTLTSSTASGNLLVNNQNVLSANTVYTVMAGGDVAAPQLLIR